MLLMSKLFMFAVKSWQDEAGGGGGGEDDSVQSFPCLQTTAEADDDFPEGIPPQIIAPA